MTGAPYLCLKFWYSYYYIDTVSLNNDHKVEKRYGIFCPFTTGSLGKPTKVSITDITLSSDTGLYLTRAYGGWSKHSGDLVTLRENTFFITTPEVISIEQQSINPAKAGPGYVKISIEFKFTTPLLLLMNTGTFFI